MKLAAAQIDVAFGDVERNLATIRARAETAAKAGAELAVFPECAVTGYSFATQDEARRVAITADGREVAALAELARATRLHLVVGTIEKESERPDARLFNTAFLIGPGGTSGADGVLLHYRKLHLPFLGCDRFVTPGDRPLAVASTPLGRIGLSICYDGSFPETARVLKLRGAQLVVLPTNWPDAAAISRQHQSIVRAMENHVNYVACNRVGSEGGFGFPGGSQIVDFTGRVIAQGGSGEELLFAELDLAGADRNRIVNVPGQYELDRIAHRRPDQYGPIVTPIIGRNSS